MHSFWDLGLLAIGIWAGPPIAVTAIVFWDQIGSEYSKFRQNCADFFTTPQPKVIPSMTHMGQMMSKTHGYHHQHLSLSGDDGMNKHRIPMSTEYLF
jgi:hypothetical protein